MRMSEGDGSIVGGSLQAPVDWNYPISHFSSKDYLHQEPSYYDEEEDDDDIDSYYMDLPPIDMAERLKEVNRALAEDSTPIDLKRTTKLRFKEVIAEYQSPRDSDSDDGYGDSSEIMFDAEEENDILYTSTPGPSKSSTSEDNVDKNSTDTDLPLETALSASQIEEEDSKFKEISFSTSSSAAAKNTIPVPPKYPLRSILAPSTREETSSSDEEILEESKDIEERVEIKKFKLLGSTADVEESEKLFNKTPSPLEIHNFSDYGDEDVFEVESEISEEIEVETNVSHKDSPDSSQVNDKPKKDLSVYIVNSNKTKVSNKSDDETKSSNDSSLVSSNQNLPLCKENLLNLGNENGKQFRDFHSAEKSEDKKTVVANDDFSSSSSEKLGLKSENKDSFESEIACRLSTTKREQPQPHINQMPAIKPSLSPYDISMHKDLRNRKPISKPTANNEMRRNRSRLNAFHVSPTKTPSGVEVPSMRSNRDTRARRGSPVMQRSSRSQEKPLKAVHNQSLTNLTISEQYNYNSNKKAKLSKLNFSQNGVRKAASTSDLCRSSSEDQEKINKLVYEKWLQQKNREAAIIKRQQEEAKAADKAAAATKLEERKKMAEEAFQQWLRRKRDQLKMEKKLKHQQKRLDSQTSYAKTRIQCEEAYKEWCKRKNEEANARKAAPGGSSSIRSQSLERSWIQEKTRKLYSAYISK